MDSSARPFQELGLDSIASVHVGGSLTAAPDSKLSQAETIDLYLHEYQTSALRCKVFAAQAAEAQRAIGKHDDEMRVCATVCNELRQKDAQMMAEIKRLERELVMVRICIAEQEAHHAKAMQLRAEAAETLGRAQTTLVPLLQERDKARFILMALAPHVVAQLPPD